MNTWSKFKVDFEELIFVPRLKNPENEQLQEKKKKRELSEKMKSQPKVSIFDLLSAVSAFFISSLVDLGDTILRFKSLYPIDIGTESM